MDTREYINDAIDYAVDSAKNEAFTILVEMINGEDFDILIEQDISEGIAYTCGSNERAKDLLLDDYYEEIYSEVRSEFIDYLKRKL